MSFDAAKLNKSEKELLDALDKLIINHENPVEELHIGITMHRMFADYLFRKQMAPYLKPGYK